MKGGVSSRFSTDIGGLWRDFGSLDSANSSTFEITRFLEEAMIDGMDKEALSALEEFVSNWLG